MAKSTPAHIIYQTANGEEQTLNFHAVMSEDHGASSQITKFPVQTGKHISNHAIRNNRTISLTGAFSNYGFTSEDVAVGEDIGQLPRRPSFGSDTNKAMFDVLESLVQSAQECKVVTNLGIYDPVIFNKYSTKQASGTVDTLNFTISGEEVIKVSESSRNAPVPLAFNVLSGPQREAVVYELDSLGISVSPEDEVSKADWNIGEDFTISGVDEVGNAVKTTWVYKGRDPVFSGKPNYEVHFSESAVEVSGADSVASNSSCCSDTTESLKNKISAGVDSASNCFTEELEQIALEEAENLVSTAMGDLKKSIYGYVYDITSGDTAGAAILKAGLGCVIQTVTDSEETNLANAVIDSLPTTSDMIEGARSGLGFGEIEKKKASLIQVKSGCAC